MSERVKIGLTDNWKFIKEDISQAKDLTFDDSVCQDVCIPHTWNAADGAEGFDFFKGACWYRKEFLLTPEVENKRVFIEFQGSNSITDVYLNGKHMGQHRGGYSTFRFDVTDAAIFGGMNLLSVKVDNTVVDDVYPLMADFTFYGGIYRDVSIIITNSVHFDLLDFGSQGVYIIQDDVNDEKAELRVKSKLKNDTEEDKKVRILIDILDAKGNKAAYGIKEIVLPAGKSSEVEVPVIIEYPILWNGLENPHMYTSNISIMSFNDTIDALSIPFGARYYHVDAAKGFFLNGKHLALHGVSRHQDRKDMGWAITEKEQEEDLKLIKEVGATSIRLAHYQHNQYFYNLCDNQGMVLWAETPFISIMSKTDAEGTNAILQMTELIRQNFNHPSIMFWGIQNEIQISGERPELRVLVNKLNELTKKEDPTRLTTMANVMFVPDDDNYNHVTDVVGYNKYYGWYQGEAGDFAPWLDGFHKTNPDVKLCISEYGAEGIMEYHSDTPKVKDYTESYHALYHETVWKIFSERPFLWATYVWNMFDFGANIRDEGGVRGRNNKGLVSYDRKTRKDAFYLYKANWSSEKFVHITSKRFVDRVENSISIKVYSNCADVTLFVNSVKIETKSSTDGIFKFESVALQDGVNNIKVSSAGKDGLLVDRALFNKVAKTNESYEAPADGGGLVSNWFDMPDVDNAQVEELKFGDDVFSTKCTFGALMENKDAKVVLTKYLGEFDKHPMFAMAQGFVVEMMAEMAPEIFSEKLLYSLNKDLIKIKKS